MSAKTTHKFTTTDQDWAARTKVPTDNFHLKSTKYSGKYDYNPKHVAVGWTLHDATDLIGEEMTP